MLRFPYDLFARTAAGVVLVCTGALTTFSMTGPTGPLRAVQPQFRASMAMRVHGDDDDRAPRRRSRDDDDPPLPPPRFNPDPGGVSASGPTMPAQPRGVGPMPELIQLFPTEPILPLTPVPAAKPGYGLEPVPPGLKLPRYRVEDIERIKRVYEYRHYEDEPPVELPPNTEVVTNRWMIDFGNWKRYQDPSTETPYQRNTPRLFHPYQQSTLKGDVPILGQDIFMNLTIKNFSLAEHRRLPTPSGVSAARPNSSEFFGRSEQSFYLSDTSVVVDIFKGETVFKPLTWDVRLMGVYNVNYIQVRENNVVDADPRGVGFSEHDIQSPQEFSGAGVKSGDVNPQFGNSVSGKALEVNPGDPVNFIRPNLRNAGNGKYIDSKNKRKDFQRTRYTTRFKDFFALQEAFGEIHIKDLSENYDFNAIRIGIQPFVSDFRGFIFADTNRGIRLFGNYDNNRLQYNVMFFDMLEKDTYSDLNTFDSRDQYVLVINVFRQDFFDNIFTRDDLRKGYTAQWSFHMNLDRGDDHFDKNDLITRPELLGTVRRHNVNAFYLGWTGDGHIGRFNVTHALYQVFGKDNFNGLAGRPVLINAQMAALELSYDRDWIRYKLSGFYASGDHDPTDRWANGFDTILDKPFFIGGPFSWYVHQGFNLAGTAINLKQRDSLVVDMRSSKTEGQSNFVNPGVAILGIGSDLELTPKLRAFANANYIWLAETEPIERALLTNKANRKLGLDVSLGFKYRPLLTNNIIMSLGLGVFVPGQGYKDIYRQISEPVPGFGPQDNPAQVDRFLYNAFFTLTMTY